MSGSLAALPRFTALIDTYNHERFIAAAIESVLEQDFPASEVEILVIDDGSTDGTRDVIRSRFGSDGRVRLIEKRNGGQASAFNMGIRESRGEVIAFLDGDDWWGPGKLRRVADYFDAHPDVGVVGHGIEQVEDASGASIRTVPADEREFSFGSIADADQFRRMLCFFGTSRLAIRREVALRTLPIPDAIKIQADEFLAIVSAAHAGAAVLREPLTFYRLHGANLFQMPVSDEAKLRTMRLSLEAIAAELPSRLRAAGISEAALHALLLPLDNFVRRLKLRLDGGLPWETFRVERFERNYAYRASPLSYHLYSLVSLGLTLLLPPRAYYKLRERYTGSRLRRWRGLLGEPVSASPVTNVPATLGGVGKAAAIRST